jgi:hypothetical protein
VSRSANELVVLERCTVHELHERRDRVEVHHLADEHARVALPAEDAAQRRGNVSG